MDDPNRQRRTAPPQGLRKAATLTRSGVRRYPGELMDSINRRDPSHSPLVLEHAAARGPLAAAWLGHATVLLRIGDQWVLTDPVFSHRIGIRLGPLTMGVGRLLPPFDLSSLPPIDLILISHAHFDHLDKPTLKKLVSPRTRVVTAENTGRLIPRGFGDVQELGWDDTVEVGPLALRAFRPAHWGARTAWDKHRGFNSYIIESGNGDGPKRVLFAGDTAFSPAFREVGGEKGVDLSVFGIGAYDPWVHAHATPEEVWEMHEMVKGRFLLPMHHSTFRLSDEPLGEPLKRLVAAAGHHAPRIVGRELGAVWSHPEEPK